MTKFRSALEARRGRAHALRFYGRFIPRDGLCFDVGANMGNRTELFLALGARVVAVEPLASCVAVLRERFGDRIELIQGALGSAIGEADMLVADYHTLSSFSREWVAEVQASGRFAEFSWDSTERVPVTTLDALVERYGIPNFCKIDVEGYELEVLSGLSQPVGAVSFEFSVERLESRLQAVEQLASLGMDRFNFSFGETLTLAFNRWTDSHGMSWFLRSPEHTTQNFGDVYATRSVPRLTLSERLWRSTPKR